MIIYGLWQGGANYSLGSIPEDIERFTGIKQAGRVLRERDDNGGYYTFPTFYVHRENHDVYFPCVEGSSMDLYDSPDAGEPYARLTIGPRGGVVRENY